MRIFSILTAIVVAAVIYLFVFQRDFLFSFGTDESQAPQMASAQPAPAAAAADTPGTAGASRAGPMKHDGSLP